MNNLMKETSGRFWTISNFRQLQPALLRPYN